MHGGRSLAGQLLGLVLVVVGSAVALHWAYDLLLPMFWLVPVVGAAVAVLLGVRVWRRRFLSNVPSLLCCVSLVASRQAGADPAERERSGSEVGAALAVSVVAYIRGLSYGGEWYLPFLTPISQHAKDFWC
jgi:hypothetical protein